MIPIEKNIKVVDVQGNILESTYPKRAKGLVKNGRAHFINEDTICLACPPIIKERTKMDNNNTINKVNSNLEENIKDYNSFDDETGELQLSAKDILEKIDDLQKSMNSNFSSFVQLTKAIETILGDEESNSEQYEIITDVCMAFQEREKNFLKILQIYEKMYDSII